MFKVEEGMEEEMLQVLLKFRVWSQVRRQTSLTGGKKTTLQIQIRT